MFYPSFINFGYWYSDGEYFFPSPETHTHTHSHLMVHTLIQWPCPPSSTQAGGVGQVVLLPNTSGGQPTTALIVSQVVSVCSLITHVINSMLALILLLLLFQIFFFCFSLLRLRGMPGCIFWSVTPHLETCGTCTTYHHDYRKSLIAVISNCIVQPWKVSRTLL